MQIFLKKLTVLSLILFLSACGFQLRGDIQANFDSISITGGSPSFNKTLQRKFRQAGISIENAAKAEKVVEIIKNNFTKTILPCPQRLPHTQRGSILIKIVSFKQFGRGHKSA